jgi:hypothetical protein
MMRSSSLLVTLSDTGAEIGKEILNVEMTGQFQECGARERPAAIGKKSSIIIGYSATEGERGGEAGTRQSNAIRVMVAIQEGHSAPKETKYQKSTREY